MTDHKFIKFKIEEAKRSGALGAHVKIDPATDMWMRGGTRGIAVKAGRKWVDVIVYCGGRPVRHRPYKFAASLLEVE